MNVHISQTPEGRAIGEALVHPERVGGILARLAGVQCPIIQAWLWGLRELHSSGARIEPTAVQRLASNDPRSNGDEALRLMHAYQRSIRGGA